MTSAPMTSRLGNGGPRYADLVRLRPPRAYLAVKVAALILGVIAPLIGAWIATGRDRWDLFAQSGSITSAVGLLLASRRYLGHGILELAIMHRNNESRPSMVELLEDIHTTKMGLAISAFGTIIWGWGKYLGWWSFSCLVVWAVIAALDAWRDFVRLRGAPTGVPPAAAGNKTAGPGS
jgi:uncharacterized membrane protein